jgi:hypothetical protein
MKSFLAESMKAVVKVVPFKSMRFSKIDAGSSKSGSF